MSQYQEDGREDFILDEEKISYWQLEMTSCVEKKKTTSEFKCQVLHNAGCWLANPRLITSL